MLPEKPLVAGSSPEEDSNNSPDQSENGSISGHSGLSQQKTLPSSSKQENKPPLPDEAPPPLPNEVPPTETEDDGWEPVWDDTAQAFYFYNRITRATQWENPRVPEVTQKSASIVKDSGPPGISEQQLPKKPVAGGYDPAIHGDYDPHADYAKRHDADTESLSGTAGTEIDPATAYAATGAFNRFTGKWQSAEVNPENYNDENKSKRQMNAFFDVDAAANAHDGKSLKAERSSKKLSKRELKAFKEKRRERKEEKRRAWLRD